VCVCVCVCVCCMCDLYYVDTRLTGFISLPRS